MKILIDGYIDKNLGDDLMMSIALDGLNGHDVSINSADNERTDYDLYLKVTGSGFLIHNRRGVFYRLSDMRREKKRAVKRAVINCNISEFPCRAAESAIKKQLKDYDFITVRDKKSYEYIRKNLPDTACEMYPDIVFSLPESMIPSQKSEGLLGLAVHSSMNAGEAAKAADMYIERTGKDVLLLAFNSGSENDTEAAENIRAYTAYPENVHVVKYTSFGSMLRSMKRCAVIAGARLHAVILAARMGIDFVPLAYSDKMNGVLDSIGYNGTILRADTDAGTLINNILNPPAFSLDSSVIMKAGGHIKSLREYIETVCMD